MKTLMSLLISLLFPLISDAIVFSGELKRDDGSVVESGEVQFELSLVSGECILYKESHSLNMSDSKGVFSLQLGKNSNKIYNTNGDNVFAQKQYTCMSGEVITPAFVELGAVVKVGVDVIDAGVFSIPKTAKAYQAEELRGLGPDAFIQVDDSVTQTSVKNLVGLTPLINQLISGASDKYAKPSDIPTSSNVSARLEKSQNLADLTDIVAARGNLGLGALSTKSSISDNDIASVNWGKVVDAPSVLNYSQVSSMGCNSWETVKYESVTDSWACQDISISESQISGSIDASKISNLGSLATKNTVDYASDIINKPDFGSLAFKATVDYVTDIVNKPALGSLSLKSKVSDSDITDVSVGKVSGIGALATRDTVSNAQINDVSFLKLTDVPSFSLSSHAHTNSEISGLGSLATKSQITDSDIASGAAIATSKIAPGTLSGDYTVTGTLVANRVYGAAFNNNSSLAFNFNNGQNQYTSGNCGAITITNIPDGAIMNIVVKGTTSATCSFSTPGLTYKASPVLSATTSGKETVFSLIRIGSTVYINWTSGF